MNAAEKSGVSTDPNVVKDKLLRLALMIGKLDEATLKKVSSLSQCVLDGVPWEFERKLDFDSFLCPLEPNQSVFNQLMAEFKWWEFLNQIEEICFLDEELTTKAEPFIKDLWKDEVADNPFNPPAGWEYLAPETAIDSYRKFLNKDLKVDSTLEVVKQKALLNSEGFAVWPKLTTLARIFNVSGNPLENTEKGKEAYAKIVELLIPKIGEAYVRAYPKYSFKNWREGALTANHISLTSAGRKTWQKLEQETKDDFVIASVITGRFFAGYSVRRFRIKIVLSGNQIPQDCIMIGSTIAIQPDRLTKHEDLCINCPANCYSSGADADFSSSLYFRWNNGGLHFGNDWAGSADWRFGSASCFSGQ